MVLGHGFVGSVPVGEWMGANLNALAVHLYGAQVSATNGSHQSGTSNPVNRHVESICSEVGLNFVADIASLRQTLQIEVADASGEDRSYLSLGHFLKRYLGRQVGHLFFLDHHLIGRLPEQILDHPATIAYGFRNNESLVGYNFPYGMNTTFAIASMEAVWPLLRDSTVLDVGAGDGILSVVAAKLGASRVFGVELQPSWGNGIPFHAKMNKVHDRVDGIIDDVRSSRIKQLVASQRPTFVIANLGGVGFVDGHPKKNQTAPWLLPQYNLHISMLEQMRTGAYYMLCGIPPEYSGSRCVEELIGRFIGAGSLHIARLRTRDYSIESEEDDCYYESHLFWLPPC